MRRLLWENGKRLQKMEKLGKEYKQDKTGVIQKLGGALLP